MGPRTIARMVQSSATVHPPATPRTYWVGVGFLVFAALFWSLNGAFVKIINQGGRGPDGVSIAFYRSFFGGLLLAPVAVFNIRRKRSSAIGRTSGTSFGAKVICVVLFALMTTCFVVAATKTEAANAIILQYTSTFWVFVLSPVVLGESADWRDAWTLAVAITGMIVLFVGNGGSDLFGLLIALSAGLFYGLLTLMLRRLRSMDAAAITVINNLGAALILFPIALCFSDPFIAWRPLLLLALMGGVQFALPYYFYSLGLERVPAHQAALITMIEPLLVPLWAYLAVGETVTRHTAIGGGLILLAVLLMFAVGRRGRATTLATATS